MSIAVFVEDAPAFDVDGLRCRVVELEPLADRVRRLAGVALDLGEEDVPFLDEDGLDPDLERARRHGLPAAGEGRESLDEHRRGRLRNPNLHSQLAIGGDDEGAGGEGADAER